MAKRKSRKHTREALPPRSRRIYDAIVSVVESGRNLRQGWWGVDVSPENGVYNDPASLGSVCAVGAGCLWRPSLSKGRDAIEGFSVAHGVPEVFAAGVSDGFEGSTTRPRTHAKARACARAYFASELGEDPRPARVGKNDLRDYLAGVRLGITVRHALLEKDGE